MGFDIQTFFQWFNQDEANGLKFWGPGFFHWVTLDLDQRLRMSWTPICKFRKARGMLVKMDSHNYNIYMVLCVLCLDQQYKRMLMATPLANGIEDFHWTLHFLESSSCKTLQVPPDTFNYTLNIDDYCIAYGSTVSGTECGAWFTPVIDPYKQHPRSGWLVHCTTTPLNPFMSPLISRVEKLRMATPI